MSQLREQLRTARSEYESTQYPGDLADEVLPAPRRLQIGRWALLGAGFGAGSLAAAAAIAVALVNVLPTEDQQPGQGMIARVASGGTFSRLSQLPQQLNRLTTVIPVETLRSTLHYLGVQPEQNPTDNNSPQQDGDHAAA